MGEVYGKNSPVRQVAGGHRGINLHLSELVSDLMEPMVGAIKGGREAISTEDMVAKVEGVNKNMEGWTKTSWWEGEKVENYVACGKCEGKFDIQMWDEKAPELCTCGMTDSPDPGLVRTSSKFLKTLRRLRWEQSMDWGGDDHEGVLDSTDALAEDIQDFENPMTIVGSDVVNLYPSMEISEVMETVEEAIKEAGITWEGIDYCEAARYLALNWSEEECRQSSLRRVLPWRRGKRGSRPGMRGTGPRGKTRGDQEQWIFPPIVLEQWEKDELISQVVKIATKAMFNNHFYKFGGKMFKQREGGPIGLRGTCAVARLVLQMFDLKWESRLMDMRIKVWLITRYMDDARIFLPPIKPGWRISDGKLLFCQKWEEEDKNLSPTEVTRRVVLDSLKDVVKYLRFTTETCEDYESGWLPTLDTSLQVDLNNHIKFKFFEKPVGPGRLIQKKTAMPENSKVQIISNEMIRRLLNSGEDLQEEKYIEIVDSYAQKLVNSGYGINQVRRMLISGIRGYGGKVNRCKELGIDLRRTANKSQGARNIKKLTGRTTWFKKRKEKIDWYGMSQGAHGNGRGGPLEDQGAQPKQSIRQGGAEESSPAL